MVLRRYPGSKVILLGIGGCGAAIGLLFGFSDELKRVRACLASSSQQNNSSSTGKWDFNWDRREPASLVKPSKSGDPQDENRYNEKLQSAKSTATRHLLLIRHGHFNQTAPTDEGRTLTLLGQEQAHWVGQRLKDLGLPYQRIVHSTMTRAINTAGIIHKFLPDVPLVSCDFIREGAPYPPEPPSARWRPEAKQFLEDGTRIEAAFRKYFHRAEPSQKKDSYEVLVCHANVIRYFVCRALQFPPEAWLRFALHHCSITWLAIRPSGKVIVYTVGDSGHIPVDKLSVTTS